MIQFERVPAEETIKFGNVSFILICAILIFLLSACSTSHYSRSTGYVKFNPLWTSRYGYSDKHIGGDEFSIVAKGNSATSKQQVAKIALLRAAYLTQEKGRLRFVILNKKTQILSSGELISLPIGGSLIWIPVGAITIKEPIAILVIRLLRLKASYTSRAIDAEKIIELLAKKIK